MARYTCCFVRMRGWRATLQRILDLLAPQGVNSFTASRMHLRTVCAQVLQAARSFFTPTGWHFTAQGIALGRGPRTSAAALKGHKNSLGPELLRPFRAGVGRPTGSQGDAL